MERTFDYADRHRQNETRGSSSDTPSQQSARDRNLVGMGLHPGQWSEQASTSSTSDSHQEKQALQYEERKIRDTLSRIEHNITVYYKEYLTDSDDCEVMEKVHNKIGDQHLQARRHKEALFFYNTALAFNKDSKTALQGRNNCLSILNGREINYQGERQELHNITHPEFNLISKIQQDIIEGYRQHLKDYGGMASTMQRVYNKIGDQHLQARRHDEALFSYNIALALDKHSKTALKGRGATLRELNRFNEALIDLNKAIELSIRPGPFTLANRGATLQELGYPDKALTDLNKALKKDPENLLALAYRGAAYRELGQPNNALPDLNKVLERDPNNLLALAHRGATLRELGQLDKALPDLNKALEQDPNNTFALAHRGVTYRELGQPNNALPDLNKVLERDPNNTFALAHRGATYRVQGQLDKALTDLHKVLERGPNNTFALAHRGAAYLALGQLDKALADLHKALERDPKNAFATETRAKVYQDMQQ